MTGEIIIAERSYKGLTYHEYMDRTKIKLLSTNLNILSDMERETFDYTKLNLQRSLRIEKNYTVSEKLKSLMLAVTEGQLWMVITEDWCGDSAQNLPYIASIATCNPKINLRILLRDSNPEVMELYLTNGTRSIPKMVAFDSSRKEIFRWGPRPKAAQVLFDALKKDRLPKSDLYEKLHAWYSKNRGKEIEKEFIDLLSH